MFPAMMGCVHARWPKTTGAFQGAWRRRRLAPPTLHAGLRPTHHAKDDSVRASLDVRALVRVGRCDISSQSHRGSCGRLLQRVRGKSHLEASPALRRRRLGELDGGVLGRALAEERGRLEEDVTALEDGGLRVMDQLAFSCSSSPDPLSLSPRAGTWLTAFQAGNAFAAAAITWTTSSEETEETECMTLAGEWGSATS